MKVSKDALRRLGLPLALLGACFGVAIGRQGPPLPADPLVVLNDRFHDAYRRARVDRLARAGPVVLVGFNSLALIRGKARAEVPFPPAIYHKLKEVAHVPLLVFVTLSGTEGRPLDPVQVAEVRHVRDLVEAAMETIGRSGFPPDSLDLQRVILRATRIYLLNVLQDGNAPPAGLADYARTMGPLVLLNADAAASAHLAALDAQMQVWHAEMTPDEWRTMHVVVMSAHMARDREIAMQYFARLLGEATEGHRLIFAEGLFDEPKALDLLGTHILDGVASTAFFGDEMRLHRDLLSDGAAKALGSMTIRP